MASRRIAAAPRAADAVPRMENVRITAPDLQRRAALEKTRRRLVIAAAGFTVLFAAVVGKLADATIVLPLMPHRAEHPIAELLAPAEAGRGQRPARRSAPRSPTATARPLAISLPTVSLFRRSAADRRPGRRGAEAEDRCCRGWTTTWRCSACRESTRSSSTSSARSPRARKSRSTTWAFPASISSPASNATTRWAHLAAQVLGGVDVDEHGVAGVEKSFDERLRTDPTPLRLSIDIRVQAVVREELLTAMDEFQAIGACGIVMDVNTGEVLAMVSLPDYDANNFRTAPADDRFNRAVTGMYEPGSTFKLQTASMALDGGIVHIWDEFDASRPIHIGRFTITDFEGKHRWLYLPEVLAYSSNLGAAHIAVDVGAERQRAWLKKMGMFDRVPIELPEAGLPIIQSAAAWKEIVTMTVGFGHGISVSPLHVVRGTAAVANGGRWCGRPSWRCSPAMRPEGVRCRCSPRPSRSCAS